MAWRVEKRVKMAFAVRCYICDCTAGESPSEEDARAAAREAGWVDGLCPECWEREKEVAYAKQR